MRGVACGEGPLTILLLSVKKSDESRYPQNKKANDAWVESASTWAPLVVDNRVSPQGRRPRESGRPEGEAGADSASCDV